MAVPKRKTSPSRRGQRRAHDSLKRINVTFNKTTGEAQLSHHISLSDGYYNGRKVYDPKSKLVAPETTAEPEAQ